MHEDVIGRVTSINKEAEGCWTVWQSKSLIVKGGLVLAEDPEFALCCDAARIIHLCIYQAVHNYFLYIDNHCS